MSLNDLVGRAAELEKIRACLRAKRNVLLEGPVGVGKTHLALAVVRELGLPFFRVDGDHRYSEQKLTGWFDPPLVMQKGYNEESFVPGPLVAAMREGGVLFINELNRLPEGVQNVLLPAIDERMVIVPRIGEIGAKEGFLVIATQNPKEFVATSHLSEAILDRFEWVALDYQSEKEEVEIVRRRVRRDEVVGPSVELARLTREVPQIKRGASIRGALGVAEISGSFIEAGKSFEDAFLEGALIALPTRIEIARGLETEANLSQKAFTEKLIRDLVFRVLRKSDRGESGDAEKKSL